MTKKCKAAGASCYSGDTFATITTSDGQCITADVDTPATERLRIFYAHRDKTIAMIKIAPVEKLPGLRASLRGADLLVRVAISNQINR
jgi:hypothetical protein